MGRLKPDGKHHYKFVAFKPNDPDNPKNWSKAFKWYCTMVVAVTCFVIAFASFVITSDLVGVEKQFNVSSEVSLLTVTVFVVGFGVGEFLTLTLEPILTFQDPLSSHHFQRLWVDEASTARLFCLQLSSSFHALSHQTSEHLSSAVQSTASHSLHQ